MSRVITFGLHIADVLGPYVTDIPPGQGLEVIDEIRITVAETAAATAVDLAKLGVDVATVGAVGCDALGAPPGGAGRRSERRGECRARLPIRRCRATPPDDCGSSSSGSVMETVR
jgi:hypothetical protein